MCEMMGVLSAAFTKIVSNNENNIYIYIYHNVQCNGTLPLAEGSDAPLG
jgi:hypothetical protein